jgi:hypothetical protein
MIPDEVLSCFKDAQDRLKSDHACFSVEITLYRVIFIISV